MKSRIVVVVFVTLLEESTSSHANMEEDIKAKKKKNTGRKQTNWIISFELLNPAICEARIFPGLSGYISQSILFLA